MSAKFYDNASVNVQNQLVTWINDAGMAEGHKKANILRKITELLIHQSPQSIPTFIDNILSWSKDKSTEVKKQAIVFMEELSKTHPDYIPRTAPQLRLLLTDSVIAVQKRVIQAASIIYRQTLLWICTGKPSLSVMQDVWLQITELKLHILNLIDNDNEGIRTHTVKFLEEVVLLQSYDASSDDTEFTLDNLPITLPFVKRDALEEESEQIFALLIKFHNSQHISSVNLMTCMITLCSLAKNRPKFMPRVIKALGDLHTTLPPTLSQSQVNAVRKHLKAHLISLLKHSSSNESFPQITQLLLDIGMTNQELAKCLPKEKRNKRLGDVKNGEGQAKRMRIDSPQSNSQGSDNSNSRSEFGLFDDSSDVPSVKPPVTEDSIYEGLNNIDNVVSLIVSTLQNNLPASMPSNFVNVYKPIPNAGSSVQKRTLAKLIHSVVKGENPVPQTSLSDLAAKIPLLRDDDEKVTQEKITHEKITLKNAVAKLQETSKAERQIESAVSKLMEETRQDHLLKETAKEPKLVAPPTPTVPKLKHRVKLLKLQELTRPIPKDIKEKLMLQSVVRILNAEKESVIGGAAQVRAKLLTIFASSYTPEFRELVLNYILEDPSSRINLALSWLYEEYAFMQGFNRHPVTLQPKLNEKHDQNYNQLLCALITQICERAEPALENAKDMLMRRIYLEAPIVTEEAMEYLKHLVTEEKMTLLALEILEEICVMRPPRAHKYVTALLSHTINENEEIRETALKSVVKIYTRASESVINVIEKYAKLYLGFIALNSPPMDLFNEESTRMHSKSAWTDDLYKLCLNLIMALFNENEDLILEVARVYGQANADAKRCVLRCIEAPIRQLQAGNTAPRPAFLDLLDECPRGAETLLTRLVHILTEKSPPTAELVSRVRNLYATRVSDVRFLIPVLNGLTKKEVLAALPKLIKLNPVVVKEVFNKLLGLQNANDEVLPVTPVELLVALHLIDPSKADLKYIIKATALCFAEKQTYTQEVVSTVLQILVEEEEIPVLLMRSVLQALAIHPGLTGLVLNLLQRLIEKEVWQHKVAWEGWIKCCERAAAGGGAAAAGAGAVAARLPAAPRAALAGASAALAAALQCAAIEPKLNQSGNPLEPMPPGMD